MCAIIDANVMYEVFGNEHHEAGLQFRRWIYSGRGRLVVGGRLTTELSRASVKFRHWISAAQLQGMISRKSDDMSTKENLISLMRAAVNPMTLISLLLPKSVGLVCCIPTIKLCNLMPKFDPNNDNAQPLVCCIPTIKLCNRISKIKI